MNTDEHRRMKPLLLLSVLALLPQAWAAEQLAILPAEIALSGPGARQQLVVEKLRDTQFVGQITNGVELASSDTNVVRIEQGAAVPVKNGAATIRAKTGNQSASARV